MNGGELRISTGVLVDAVDALSSSIAVVVLFTFRHLIIVTSLCITYTTRYSHRLDCSRWQIQH